MKSRDKKINLSENEVKMKVDFQKSDQNKKYYIAKSGKNKKLNLKIKLKLNKILKVKKTKRGQWKNKIIKNRGKNKIGNVRLSMNKKNSKVDKNVIKIKGKLHYQKMKNKNRKISLWKMR